MNGTLIAPRVLLICPYFGDLPLWWERYRDEEIPRLRRQGYDMLLDFDLDSFAKRVEDKLGIECPIVPGTGKIWDFRPALGMLYQEEAQGYEWWGHTDFDCVYGIVPDPAQIASSVDIYTDCAYGYLAGPWTIYRNRPWMASAFTLVPSWKDNMTGPEPTGWCETSFSLMVDLLANVVHADNHAYTEPHLLRRDGDRLLHGRREISFYHFRRTKEWPL